MEFINFSNFFGFSPDLEEEAAIGLRLVIRLPLWMSITFITTLLDFWFRYLA